MLQTQALLVAGFASYSLAGGQGERRTLKLILMLFAAMLPA
jgi:hypothetical protein